MGRGDGHFLAATEKKGSIMDSCVCGEHEFYMKPKAAVRTLCQIPVKFDRNAFRSATEVGF